jgi:arylsulfatase A-like enzyme
MTGRKVLGALNTLPAMTAHGHAAAARPNIVVILASGQGYGDLTCYNLKSIIPTHQTNRVARSGMRFTDFLSFSSIPRRGYVF